MDREKLENIKNKLNKNSGGKLTEFYEHKSFKHLSSPKALEESLGIEGISYDYNFPDGMSAEEFYFLTKPFFIYAEFEDNNVNALDKKGIDWDAQGILLEDTDAQMQNARVLHAKLLALNPELKPFCDSCENRPFSKLRSLILTTTSSYPLEDVKFFAENCDSANETKYANNWIVEERTGNNVMHPFKDWCASPETMEKINKKMDEKGYPKETPEGQEQKRKNHENKIAQLRNKTEQKRQDDYFSFLEQRGFFND